MGAAPGVLYKYTDIPTRKMEKRMFIVNGTPKRKAVKNAVTNISALCANSFRRTLRYL